MSNASQKLLKLLEYATPGKWFVREHPGNQERFFVQAPRLQPTDPYDIEVLGDDDTLYPTRRHDADFIVEAHESLPAILANMDTYEQIMRDVRLFLENLPEDLGRGSLNGHKAQLQYKLDQLKLYD